MANSGLTLPGALADLARVNVRYLLEWHRDGILYKALSLPLAPNALSFASAAPQSVTYTLGEEPIRELSGFKRRTLELSGSAGYDARPAYRADGSISTLLGPIILIQFREFIERYQSVASTEGPQREDHSVIYPQHELIFRALDEDFHLKVEVREFSIQRSADEANLAPQWSLQLDAYQDALPPNVDLFDLAGALSVVTSAITTAADAVGAVALLTEGTNAYLRNGISGPLNALNALTNALRDTVNNITEIADIPIDILRQVSTTAGQTRSIISQIIDEVTSYDDEISAELNLLSNILGYTQDIENAAASTAVIFPQSADPTEAPPVTLATTQPLIEQPPQVISTAYRLRQGEDLLIIARRVFGDADRWPELMSLNGWLSYDANARGEPPRAGDLILVPDPQGGVQISNDLYGQDLRIIEGDLEMKSNDFSTISGAANLEQAAHHRLQSTQGASVLQRYGLPARIGSRLTTQSAGYLGAHIREQLTLDPRIEELTLVEVDDRGDHLQVALEFRARATATALSTSLRIN